MTPRHLLLPLSVLAFTSGVRASQYLGAEIDVRFIGGNDHEVRLLLWRDCSGAAAIGAQSVNYESPCGSGSLVLPLDVGATTDVSPLCATSLAGSACNGGALPGHERVEYAAIVSLVPCNAWTFTYVGCCLPQANNMSTATVELVVHTTYNNVDLACRNAPRFAHPGLPFRCSNTPFTLDMLGVIDGQGTAQYALVSLLTSSGTIAPYTAPVYTGPEPYPGLTISATTGILSTASTGAFGYWTIVPKLSQYDGTTLLASVERAFLMPTANLSDQPPFATGGAPVWTGGGGFVTGDRTMELGVGDALCASMTYSDFNPTDSIVLASDLASALPGASVTWTNGNPATLEFCWTAPSGSNGMHHFTVHASDEFCPVAMHQYYFYSVRVTPDPADPCGSVGIVHTPDAGVATAWFDPTEEAIAYSLPQVPGARTITVFDPLGRRLASAPAKRNGRVRLPHGTASGMVVVDLAGSAVRLMLTR